MDAKLVQIVIENMRAHMVSIAMGLDAVEKAELPEEASVLVDLLGDLHNDALALARLAQTLELLAVKG